MRINGNSIRLSHAHTLSTNKFTSSKHVLQTSPLHCETSPGALHPDVESSAQRDVDLMECVQRRATETTQGMKTSYGDRLRVGAVQPGEGMAVGELRTACQYLRGCQKEKDRLLSRGCCEREGEMVSD